MIRFFLDENGKFESSVNGSIEMVELNTQSHQIYYVDDVIPPMFQTDYWDYNLQEFQIIGAQPSKYHDFNYALRQWIDSRSIDDVRNQKWVEIKTHRDQLEFGGFTFEGNIYDSDQASQGRIMGATIAGVDQVWTLADNTTASLTASQLQQLYAALQAHISSVHERGRIARQLIFEAETKEQVSAVQL